MPVTFYSDPASLANFVFLGPLSRESYYLDDYAKLVQEKINVILSGTKDVFHVLSFEQDIVYVSYIYMYIQLWIADKNKLFLLHFYYTYTYIMFLESEYWKIKNYVVNFYT